MRSLKLPQLLLGTLLTGLLPAALGAQPSNDLIAFRFPELANYLNAFEVVQAAVMEDIIEAGKSSEAEIGKEQLRASLKELNESKGSHYHMAGSHLDMFGPYRVFESRAIPGLVARLRRETSNREAMRALEQSDAITPAAAKLLIRGNEFIRQLIAIYADNSMLDKQSAVDAVIADYLADDRASVPREPKTATLLSDHPYAYAYRVGFPQLSGLNWANQWLELATLETLISNSVEDEATQAAAMENVLSLYNDKLNREHNSMMNLPTDIPSVPVIAPNLYSAHPDAAVIVDNLSAFRIALGDVLAYPDLSNRKTAVDELVVKFTNKNGDLAGRIDYLLYVLRGGIYNQGGPAKGGMDATERNRSRAMLENKHISNLPMSR